MENYTETVKRNKIKLQPHIKHKRPQSKCSQQLSR